MALRSPARAVLGAGAFDSGAPSAPSSRNDITSTWVARLFLKGPSHSLPSVLISLSSLADKVRLLLSPAPAAPHLLFQASWGHSTVGPRRATRTGKGASPGAPGAGPPKDALGKGSRVTGGKQRKARFRAACPALGPKSPGAELSISASVTATLHTIMTHVGSGKTPGRGWQLSPGPPLLGQNPSLVPWSTRYRRPLLAGLTTSTEHHSTALLQQVLIQCPRQPMACGLHHKGVWAKGTQTGS